MAMESSSLFSNNFDMVILSLGSVSLYCIDSIAIGEVVALSKLKVLLIDAMKF
jgi:hypothetical protein